MIHTSELVSDFSELITEHHGEHGAFSHCDTFETANDGALIFIQQADQLATEASVVVTTATVAEQIKDSFKGFIAVVEDVRLAQALIKQAYDDYRSDDAEWPRIHPSAVIHDSADIDPSCRVGPNVVIGKDVQLAHGVVVRSNSVIEFESKIGANSVINSNVNIGYRTQIGSNVIVKSGAIVGNEGFGFAKDKNNHYQRIPHTGNVVIEDDVFVGCNSCIDRGTYGATLVGRGVKIDNLCHIAHNVRIAEDTILIAQTGIAGSAQIGKRVILSGQTGILDHQKVADDVVLVHRGGVMQNIEQSGAYGGFPPLPMREHIKRLNYHERAEKRFAKLDARLKALEAEQD